MNLTRQIRRAWGFSLVEVLVVIGVLAILVGLLMPVVVRARRQASLVTCTSNLRTLAQAAVLHVGEHDGYLPLAGDVIVPRDAAGAGRLPAALNDIQRRRYTYTPTTSNPAMETVVPLTAALAPYLGARGFDAARLTDSFYQRQLALKTFLCPAVSGDISVRDNTTVTLQFGDSGTQYVNMYGANPLDYAANGLLLGFDYRPIYAPQRMAGRMAAARNAAQIVLLTDARPSVLLMVWRADESSRGSLTLADALGIDPRVLDRAMFDRIRHQGRVNIAFLDGHVETLRIEVGDLRRASLLLQ